MVWLLVVDLVPGRRVEKSLTSSGEAGRRDLRVERQSLLVSVLHLLVVSDEYSRRLLLCHRLALYPIKTLAGGDMEYFAARRFASMYLASIMIGGVPVYVVVPVKPMWRVLTPCC